VGSRNEAQLWFSNTNIKSCLYLQEYDIATLKNGAPIYNIIDDHRCKSFQRGLGISAGKIDSNVSIAREALLDSMNLTKRFRIFLEKHVP